MDSLRLKHRTTRGLTSAGFTLIEMVVTIVLIAIIAGMLSPFLKSSVDGFVDTRTRAELTSKGRLLLDRLNREIREADPSSIVITGGTQLQFTQLNGLSGLQNIGGNIIKVYQACNSIIVRQSGNSLLWDNDANGTADSTLSNNVSAISFSYLPGTAIRSAVVTIELSLTEDSEVVQLYREVHILNTLATVTSASCP